MMSNLIQCLRCKQNLIREEWDQHVCNRHFKGIKNIEVLQWWETKNENGERVAFGLGSDGYTYKLNEIKEGFVELNTDQARSDGFTHREQPDKDFPEPFQRCWEVFQMKELYPDRKFSSGSMAL
jgi:hypothetical protein